MKALIIKNKVAYKFPELNRKTAKNIRDNWFGNVDRCDLRSDQERLELGILIVDVVIPENFDSDLHKLENERYDSKTNTVIYDVADRDDLPSIQELKAQKKAEFSSIIDNEVYQPLLIESLKELVKNSPYVPDSLKAKFAELEAKEAAVNVIIEQKANIGDRSGLIKMKFDPKEIKKNKEIKINKK